MKIYAARNMKNDSGVVRLHAKQPSPMGHGLDKDYWAYSIEASESLPDECSVKVFQILTGRMIEPGEVIELETDK